MVMRPDDAWYGTRILKCASDEIGFHIRFGLKLDLSSKEAKQFTKNILTHIY